MKAVILAGGQGTRMGEETQLRPKPLVEVGGRPIIWHILKLYQYYGFNDFIICADEPARTNRGRLLAGARITLRAGGLPRLAGRKLPGPRPDHRFRWFRLGQRRHDRLRRQQHDG